jgi:hypothetical protein
MEARSNTHWIAAALVAGLLFLYACGGGTAQRVIFVGESDPADFSLSNTKPESFVFEIPGNEGGPFVFALELTYFENQMQGWESLPLYYMLTRPDGTEEDLRFSLQLKDDKGGWRGTLKENQTDRIFEQEIQLGLALSPGKYSIKIFGDSKDLTKPILGIVHIAFKVYAG